MSSEGNSQSQPKRKRRGPGKPFQKGGDPRVNRGGRIKTFAARVRDICGDDPLELARIAYSIAQGKMSIDTIKPMKLKVGEDDRIVDHPVLEVPSVDDRLAALEFLRDTGWGKPKQVHEVESNGASFVIMMPAEQPE